MKRTLAALMLLLVVACGETPDRGTIVAKQIDPPWVQFVCVSYSQDGWCTMNMPIYHPEKPKFLLAIENDPVGWRHVSHDVYNGYSVGSWYIAPQKEG